MPSLRSLYLFAAGHTLLMGLLPFFMAIMVFNLHQSMSDVCAVLGFSGLTFLPAIVLFEALRVRKHYSSIAVLSFVFLLGMISLLALDQSLTFLYGLGVISGFYLCFYWLSIRIGLEYFAQHRHVGRVFGNFQIISGASMKTGILLGSLLLTYQHSGSILLMACAVVLGVAYPLLAHRTTNCFLAIPQPYVTAAVTLQAIKAIPHRHKLVFLCDGIFLYMESYFWIITLYRLVNQRFYVLSLLVVGTALILGVGFLLLKNRIDTLNDYRLYGIAVILYVVSWFLRAYVPHIPSDVWLYFMIIIIAFFTYGFRLSFNQLFFSRSQQHPHPYTYIVSKSVYSQGAIAAFFLLLAFITAAEKNNANMSYTLYFYAGFTALLYGFYAFKTSAYRDHHEPN